MAGTHHTAVVGGGTAGAAAALLLARDGHRVQLFERVAEPGPVGAGILLQPTGMAVLAELGLLDAVLTHGAPIARLHGTTPGGRRVLDVRYADLAPDAFGLGLHRGALFELLWSALPTAGVDVHAGAGVDDFRQDGAGVELRAGREVLGRCDLLVVADGTRSSLRAKLPVAQRATPYPWGALWAMVPDTGEHPGELRQWFRAARQMLGLMPTGRAPGGDARLLSLFWSLPTAALGEWRQRGLQAWKEDVLALAPIGHVLDAITDPTQLGFAEYADVRMRAWHHGRVVCLGDCAHATSPQLGQGANLALVDAHELARALRRDPDVRGALARYDAARRSHLRYYQWASRALTPFFQSHSRLASALRDLALGPLCRTPWLKGEMARTLGGNKAGLLWGRYRHQA
jgi:2-polyprenyl-6-methoxyphenol hydroxylase-like FAD-dependent oxidoreductase